MTVGSVIAIKPAIVFYNRVGRITTCKADERTDRFTMTYSDKRLVILDADGTTIDAFQAISATFSQHDMDIGDLSRFQRRHNLFKYLGGVKEFPKNLKKQLSKVKRSQLIATLTEVYREQGCLYEGIREMIQSLIEMDNTVVGVVTRNITNDPVETLKQLFGREGIDVAKLDFMIHIPLRESKTQAFRQVRDDFAINPALCSICGDEHKDYAAAVATGMHPYIVSYGFENYERLTDKFEIPPEIVSRSPQELSRRLFHALACERVQSMDTGQERATNVVSSAAVSHDSP